MTKNQHGLSRDIPSPTKRAIRQECFFGCVICGSFVCDYDHITPFVDVHDHLVSDIALVCVECHNKKTRGFLAPDAIRKARLSPYRKYNPWPTLKIHPEEGLPVKIGGAVFLKPREILRINNQSLFAIREPENPEGPPRISAKFYNTKSELCLEIDDNECLFSDSAWDIESSGTTLIVRESHRKIALKISLAYDGISIERMRMSYSGIVVDATKDWLQLGDASSRFKLAGIALNPEVAIDIKKNTTQKTNRPSCTVREKRKIDIHGHGGSYKISGGQPENSEIVFSGNAHSLTIDGDVSVTIGASGASIYSQHALSLGYALTLEHEGLVILIGKGVVKHSLVIN